MGITTYTSARILKGQLQNQTGEETVMTMDTFPSVGLVKVKQLEKPQEMSKVFIKITKQTTENQHNLRFAKHS